LLCGCGQTVIFSQQPKHTIQTIMFNEAIFKTLFFSRGGVDHYGNAKWGISPAFHWGAPGAGKTEIANKLAKVFGCDFIHPINLADNSPAEIGGAMFPHESRQYFERLPAKWVWEANNAKRALIIFDEFGDAPKLMQSIAQKVLNERIVGDTKLKGHVRFACFGNPPEMSTNAEETGMAVANRGCHFELRDSVEFLERWKTWLIEDAGEVFQPEQIDADGLEKTISEHHGADLGNAVGTVIAFTDFRHKDPKRTADNQYGSAGVMLIPPETERNRAWSSYRTMTFMTRWLAAAHRHGLSELDVDRGIAAFVGEAMLKEFSAWRFERKDLPRIEDVLDGVVAFKHKHDRPDITLHILSGGSAVAFATKDQKLKKERAKMLWSIMKEITRTEPDLCFTAATSLQKINLGGKNEAQSFVRTHLWDCKDIVEHA